MKILRITICFIFFAKCCCSQSLYQQGLDSYANDNDSLAIEFFTKAINNNEELAKSYTMRGAAELNRKLFSKASSDLNYSLSIDSNYSKTYLYLWKFYMIQGFNSNAMKYLNVAIKKDPNDPRAYTSRAYCRGKSEDYKGCIEDLNYAIKLDSTKSEYYLNRGVSKFYLKMYNESIDDYNRAIKLSPTFNVYTNRGITYAAMGMHEKAIKDFTTSIEMITSISDAYYYRGISYLAIKKKKEACLDFEKCAEIRFEPAILAIKENCLK